MNDVVLTSGMVWWITIIEIPIVIGLIWYMIRQRTILVAEIEKLTGKIDSLEAAFSESRKDMYQRVDRNHEDFMGFRVEAEQRFASLDDMKQVETRMTNHMTRIENKVDQLFKLQNNNA